MLSLDLNTRSQWSGWKYTGNSCHYSSFISDLEPASKKSWMNRKQWGVWNASVTFVHTYVISVYQSTWSELKIPSFLLLGHVIQRISLQQLEFQLFKVHSSSPANKAAKQKQKKRKKENKWLDRTAFPASHWQCLRHAALSLSATGLVSIPGVWASRLCSILAAVHQAGRCAFAGDLGTLLSPGSPKWRGKLELHEGVCWNTPAWSRETPRDENVLPVSYRKRQQRRICSLFHA